MVEAESRHCDSETSLHVQRKRRSLPNGRDGSRNISACAEKTKSSFISNENVKKHLCMCRENSRVFAVQNEDQETSLHVQRKHCRSSSIPSEQGNISACAEKTASCQPSGRCSPETSLHVQRKHPHRHEGRTGIRKHLCMCREN